MKKKGFSLVELLAVIVVLAIIAVIVTPILYRAIGNSKESAFKNKIYALEEAARTYYEELILSGGEDEFKLGLSGIYSLTINLSNKEEVNKLNIKGKTFEKGIVTITEDGDISITAIEDKYCGEKLSSSKVINMLDIKENFTCYLLNGQAGNNLGTGDILSAIQDLKNSNEELKLKVNDLNETIKDMNNTGIGTTNALNKIYPVGSIYVSTTLKKAEEVNSALGGTWEAYGDGKVLRGTTGTSEETGGTNGSISLTTANIPTHSHSYTPAGTIKSTFKGTKVNSGTQSANHTHTFSGTTSTNGNHIHGTRYNTSVTSGSGTPHIAGFNKTGVADDIIEAAGDHAHTYSGTTSANSANHYHSVTAAGTVTSAFTGTASNTGNTGSSTAFSVLDPYITVYMYKRVS